MQLPNSNSYLSIQLATPKWAIEQVHATTVKEVESIELKPGTAPISWRAYQIAPKEAELKTQLQECWVFLTSLLKVD